MSHPAMKVQFNAYIKCLIEIFGNIKSKNRASIIREANKRLSQNPRDAEALKSLADMYYQDENFEKARKTYEILIDLCATNKELDEFEITLRYAISSLRTKKLKEAYHSFYLK